jgi:hypothetical protein
VNPPHNDASWRGFARTLTSALLFAIGASVLLQSLALGVLVTLTLLFHELGHVALLSRFDISWEVRFGLFGAATVTAIEERKRLDHYQNSLIHLAGPLANVCQALGALGVHGVTSIVIGGDAAVVWLRVANFAALMALINLLPLGHLSDGGKFAGRLFASLTESSESRLLWKLLIWLASLIWIVAVSWGDLARTIGTLAVGVWYVAGMVLESHEDDPADAGSARAMTFDEGARLFAITGAGTLLSTALVVLAPFWLTRAHALAIAGAVADLLAALRSLV